MSGGFNPISMVAQVALAAATGGTSLIATMALQIAEQVAKQVIQQIGQQLGLPQAAISAALGAFDAASGNVSGAAQNFAGAAAGAAGGLGSGLESVLQNAASTFQMTPHEQAQLSKAADNMNHSMLEQGIQAVNQAAKDAKSDGSSSNTKGASLLMKIALALGSVMDQKVKDMADKSDSIKGMGKIDGDNTSKYNSATAEMSALGQEIKIIGEALNNTLKSIGDAASSLARKQ